MSTSYAEKLKDPRWQKKRLEVMNAADFKCQLCANEGDQLNVHHPKYIPGRDPWEYDNLICLCRVCHDRHHGTSSRIPYVDPLPRMLRFDAAHGNKDAIALLSLLPAA